jgi:hypothetical protein
MRLQPLHLPTESGGQSGTSKPYFVSHDDVPGAATGSSRPDGVSVGLPEGFRPGRDLIDHAADVFERERDDTISKLPDVASKASDAATRAAIRAAYAELPQWALPVAIGLVGSWVVFVVAFVVKVIQGFWK